MSPGNLDKAVKALKAFMKRPSRIRRKPKACSRGENIFGLIRFTGSITPGRLNATSVLSRSMRPSGISLAGDLIWERSTRA
jgi:hypothetical protein